MDWKNWAIAVLILFNSVWMLFDGSRALLTGDYVTPSEGEYAGQLGPWSNLVQRVGVDPHSTLMKSVFIVYGVLALTMLVCYLLGYSWAPSALMAVCFLGLWYLPFGTISNLIVLFLFMMKRRRNADTSTL